MAEDTLLNLSHLQSVLDEYARNAKEIYGKNLALGGKRASGDLINSIRAQVITADGGYEVTLTLNEYWKYVEGGTKGREHPEAIYAQHFPPISAIARWIEVKPIIPRPLADGSIPSPKQLAYLIARGIAEKGIAPHPALATTIEELNGMYADKLGVALALDCSEYIAKVLPQTGTMYQAL